MTFLKTDSKLISIYVKRNTAVGLGHFDVNLVFVQVGSFLVHWSVLLFNYSVAQFLCNYNWHLSKNTRTVFGQMRENGKNIFTCCEQM